MPKTYVLVFNCGSSSIKFAVIDPCSGEERLEGLVECINTDGARIKWKSLDHRQEESLSNVDYPTAIARIVSLINGEDGLNEQIFAAGHRVVHGGEFFSESIVVDEEVLQKIESCSQLAPLHNPANAMGIRAIQTAYPTMPQIAVFDTAFHHTLPDYAYLYALPYELYEQHSVRRYGFHGTSHRYVTQEAAKLLNKPYESCALISAHLGNGCSVAAVLHGKCLDTSMGITPLEGLVMGTRSGDLDPSLHEYIADKLGLDIHQVTNLMNKKSGLLGISGVSGDMRSLNQAAEEGNERAKVAIEIFCYRLAKYIMSYMVPLGRLDALVFTGGIGENDHQVRAKVLHWLSILKFELDDSCNASHGKNNKGVITKEGSVIAMVVPTNEALAIARDAAMLISK